MADLTGFDASQVEPSSGFDPVPSGGYVAVVAKSEMKATKTGAGHFLELTFQIVEGDFRDRLLWARLNLDNPNQQAVQIARAELSAICRAVGVMAPKDSSELHDLPLVIRVGCRKRQDTDAIVNEIKGYAKREGPPLAGPATVSANTPPWER